MTTVVSANGRDNTLTVLREDGQNVTYDPRRLRGVDVYKEVTREFATGDRIQFTARDKDLGIDNRDLGNIVKLEDRRITVELSGKDGRTVSFDPTQMRTFDHGYAVTSHSSQGLTEGRVLVNIDTDSTRSLINTRLAYVSVSRASDDARIYTNDAATLGTRLATEIGKTAAVDFRQATKGPSPRHNEYSSSELRLAAVAHDYARRPGSTVVIARDPGDRRELNGLIRDRLQGQGSVSPDSTAITIHVGKPLSHPRMASQYTPGDFIRYRQGSPDDGIPHHSTATVLSVNPRDNSLTVQTRSGDEAKYKPDVLKTMTAESAVYWKEQREFAPGDRVQFTRADDGQGIRKGELGTITAIPDSKTFAVKLDRGSDVRLDANQARYLEHGYAVESVKAGVPENILFTQETAANEREIASLSRNGREVNLYTSDGSPSQKQEGQNQPAPAQAIQPPISLPQQPQSEAPAIAQTQAPAPPAARIRMGR